MVTQDLAPFCLVQGDRARLVSLNTVGLQRFGMPLDAIASLRRAFRFIFSGEGLLEGSLTAARTKFQNSVETLEIVDFLRSNHRSALVTLRRAA